MLSTFWKHFVKHFGRHFVEPFEVGLGLGFSTGGIRDSRAVSFKESSSHKNIWMQAYMDWM